MAQMASIPMAMRVPKSSSSLLQWYGLELNRKRKMRGRRVSFTTPRAAPIAEAAASLASMHTLFDTRLCPRGWVVLLVSESRPDGMCMAAAWLILGAPGRDGLLLDALAPTVPAVDFGPYKRFGVLKRKRGFGGGISSRKTQSRHPFEYVEGQHTKAQHTVCAREQCPRITKAAAQSSSWISSDTAARAHALSAAEGPAPRHAAATVGNVLRGSAAW
eukprot:6203787-Pleurochrysis_carterae.AAC.3